MADTRIAFDWDIVMNHPDHERIEISITRAVTGLPGPWSVQVAPSSRGWRISVRNAAGRASASVEWPATFSADDVEAALRRDLSGSDGRQERKEHRRG